MIMDSTARKIESSGVEQHQFTIAANENIFQTLSTRLYRDPVRAVIREVLSNAIDATLQKGKDCPLPIVTLPTELEPEFKVTDFGVGMTDEEVMKVYTQYGSSSKSDSNEVIGGLGLGSKSPFSLVSQFSVTTSKNGECNSYIAFLNENGVPCITKVDTTPSDTTGTTVSLAVKHNEIDAFHSNLKRVLYFSLLVPRVVNMESEDMTEVREIRNKVASTSISHSRSYSYQSSSILEMGGVEYDVDLDILFPDSRLASLISNDYYLVMHCNIGDVQIQASREALSYTKKSADILRGLVIRAVMDTLLSSNKKVSAAELAKDWDTYKGLLSEVLKAKIAFSSSISTVSVEEIEARQKKLEAKKNRWEKVWFDFLKRDTKTPYPFFLLEHYSSWSTTTHTFSYSRSSSSNTYMFSLSDWKERIMSIIDRSCSSVTGIIPLDDKLFDKLPMEKDSRVRPSFRDAFNALYPERTSKNYIFVRRSDVEEVSKLLKLPIVEGFMEEYYSQRKSSGRRYSNGSRAKATSDFTRILVDSQSSCTTLQEAIDLAAAENKTLVFSVGTYATDSKDLVPPQNKDDKFVSNKAPVIENSGYTGSTVLRMLYKRLNVVFKDEEQFNLDNLIFIKLFARDYKANKEEIDKIAIDGYNAALTYCRANKDALINVTVPDSTGTQFYKTYTALKDYLTEEELDKSYFFTNAKKYKDAVDQVGREDRSRILYALSNIDESFNCSVKNTEVSYIDPKSYRMLNYVYWGFYGPDKTQAQDVIEYIRGIENW